MASEERPDRMVCHLLNAPLVDFRKVPDSCQTDWGLEMATILVIDDERDACTLIRRVLTALGHETHVFTDHDPALKWLEGNPVDLVLLDIKLQHVDGISVLETIRARQPDIKVIMITGYPSVDTVKKALDLGIEDYLVKPIEIHELEERVSKALGLIL